jgi:dienelactone hydrolase
VVYPANNGLEIRNCRQIQLRKCHESRVRWIDQPRIKAKVLVLHGWEDPIVPPSDVLAFASEFMALGADWQLHAYGHAQHAFTFTGANIPERGILYAEKADRRSWAAMQTLLSESTSARPEF